MNSADFKKAQELRKAVSAFGRVKTPLKQPKTLKSRPSPFKFNYDALKIKDGKDGKDAPPVSHDTLRGIIEPLVKQHLAAQESKENELAEITPEFVKKIVQMMHELPEMDKLEVSKGIRNAQSFIYGGTKYQTSELMHGGGSSSSSSGTVYYTPTGTVNGSNTTFTPTAQPTSVNADGITYFSGAGYTFTAGNIVVDVAPSQFIRYTL